MPRALITGITGQDGSYLTEFLLNKGYEIHGLVRRSQFENPHQTCPNLRDVLGKITLHAVSLEDYSSVEAVIANVLPDECYHFAAQSFVYSEGGESETLRANIDGTYHLIRALERIAPKCKLYFAGTSEMFGNATESPQSELTRFNPRSVYGVSKLAGYHFMRTAREERGLFGCAGICFNHESPRRGIAFVTRKITSTVARIARGSPEKLKLGNLTARRDWGYSPDYIKAMWLMLQQDKPDDYVIASGGTHTVEEFVSKAFSVVNLNWKDHVQIDSHLARPEGKTTLCGNAEKARRVLGWSSSVSFDNLVEIMVKADLERYDTTSSLR